MAEPRTAIRGFISLTTYSETILISLQNISTVRTAETGSKVLLLKSPYISSLGPQEVSVEESYEKVLGLIKAAY
jgi:hypothetical protein